MRFPKLKTLTLNCEYFPHYYLMALLCSAPALTELTLSSLDIQLNVMENIHSELPLLTSLIIYNSSLEFTQQLEEVHPCESITLFHTVFSCPSQGEGGNMEGTWLNYIRLKYPNLTDFTFRSFTDESPIDLMATVVSMENAHQYFFQLGSKLKKLNFYRSSIPGFYFDVLEDNGYQLEEFNIVIGPYDNLLSSLFKSNQANSIQKLTLKNVGLNLLARLATMRLLNDLTLDSDGSEVMSSIGNIVRVCPLHLKSLTQKSLTLYWGGSTSTFGVCGAPPFCQCHVW